MHIETTFFQKTPIFTQNKSNLSQRRFLNNLDSEYSPMMSKEKNNNEVFRNTYKPKPYINSKKLPSVFEIPKE